MLQWKCMSDDEKRLWRSTATGKYSAMPNPYEGLLKASRNVDANGLSNADKMRAMLAELPQPDDANVS